jgi:acyl carrier protein
MSFWDRCVIAMWGHSDGKNIREVREKLSKRPQLDSESFADTYFPAEKQAIARRLWEITKEHSVADITGVTPEDQFQADLKMDDLDSMSTVELVVHLEGIFNISIPDGRIKEIRTFGELVDEIYQIKRYEIIRDPSTSSG